MFAILLIKFSDYIQNNTVTVNCLELDDPAQFVQRKQFCLTSPITEKDSYSFKRDEIWEIAKWVKLGFQARPK